MPLDDQDILHCAALTHTALYIIMHREEQIVADHHCFRECVMRARSRPADGCDAYPQHPVDLRGEAAQVGLHGCVSATTTAVF